MFLPSDLITEILLKLPVKSLIRFKCVCKSWLSLVSDPHFAISHFNLAATRSEKLIMFSARRVSFTPAPSVPEFRSIDLNASLHDDSAASAFKQLQFLCPESYTCVQIIGSCRGLVLLDLKLNDTITLCVWNPSTGVHKFIDSSPIASASDVGLNFSKSVCGFGYDSSTDDYMAVLASYKRDDRATRVECFSLRANAWKEIEATHLSYRTCSSYNINKETGLFLNGAIHWLAFRYDISMNIILVFDLIEKSFSDILLPVDFVYTNFRICFLRVVGELLGLCAERWNHSVEIWTMKKYKVQSSWTKTVAVSVDNFPTQFFFPICSTKSGDIVGTDSNSVLVKCNDKGQLREHRSYYNDKVVVVYTDWAVYTESLLSFPCNIEQAEEVGFVDD